MVNILILLICVKKFFDKIYIFSFKIIVLVKVIWWCLIGVKIYLRYFWIGFFSGEYLVDNFYWNNYFKIRYVDFVKRFFNVG